MCQKEHVEMYKGWVKVDQGMDERSMVSGPGDADKRERELREQMTTCKVLKVYICMIDESV